MFKNAIDLFDIFGFKIRADPSWLLIAALIVWSLSTSYFPVTLEGYSQGTYISMSIIAMLGLFASLIFHELSHSLVARRFDLKVGGITLFLFGGVAELEQEPRDPKSEFWIAIAGPLSSYFLAVVAYTFVAMLGQDQASTPLYAVLSYLGLINIILATFNLFPAFPLDGGRVFRAALWHFKGDLMSATRIASQAGTFFGIALIILGVMSIFTDAGIGGLWQILIGFFIMSASRGSYEQLVLKTALKDQTVRTAMSAAPKTADVHETVEDVVNNIMLKHNIRFVPVLDGDRLLGFVDLPRIQQIEQQNWPSTRLADVYIACDDSNTVPPDMPTEDVFRKMSAEGQRKFLIAEKGHLLGVIALADLMTYLALRQGLSGQQKPPRR
jgi:Zn-dependent protease